MTRPSVARPSKRGGTLRVIAALATVACVAAPPPSAGAQQRGTTTIALDGAGAKHLKAQGVRIAARRPAKLSQTRRLVLPVRSGVVGRTARLDHQGGLVLRRGRHTLLLSKLRMTLGSRSALSAVVNGRRRTILTSRKRASLDVSAGTASLRGARLSLTPAGASLIARKLRLRRVLRSAFGTVRVSAVVRAAPGSAESSTGTGTSGRGGTAPDGGSSSGSAGGSGSPSTTPITNEPPVLARPASAVAITSAQLNWHVRDSFIQYINSGEGTSVSRGATNGPKTTRPGSPLPLVYDFGFSLPSGWWDAGTQTAGVYHQGTVNFKHTLHGIDFDAMDPEIEINGARSRAIFRFDGRANTQTGNKRAVLVNLHLDRAASITHDAKSHTYTRVPGTVADGADASIFAGFYEPGEEFGWVDIAFTTG